MSLKLCSSKIVFMLPLCRVPIREIEGLWHAISKLSVAHPNLNFLEKSIRLVDWLSGNWITSITSIPQLWFGGGGIWASVIQRASLQHEFRPIFHADVYCFVSLSNGLITHEIAVLVFFWASSQCMLILSHLEIEVTQNPCK